MARNKKKGKKKTDGNDKEEDLPIEENIFPELVGEKLSLEAAQSKYDRKRDQVSDEVDTTNALETVEQMRLLGIESLINTYIGLIRKQIEGMQNLAEMLVGCPDLPLMQLLDTLGSSLERMELIFSDAVDLSRFDEETWMRAMRGDYFNLDTSDIYVRIATSHSNMKGLQKEMNKIGREYPVKATNHQPMEAQI